MKTVDTHGTFDEAVSGTDRQVEGLARQLRELIIEVYPDVVEVPWPTQRIIGYGVGPKKMSEHYCYLAALQNHVNLGFYYGAALPDPQGLLEGTGVNMRHIKVRDAEEAARPEIRTLIQAALEERKAALGLTSQ